MCVVWAGGEEYYSWKLYCKILFNVMPVARPGHQNCINGHDTGYCGHEMMHVQVISVCSYVTDSVYMVQQSGKKTEYQ